MAQEVQFNYMSLKTCYFIVRDRIGRAWNTSSVAFETYATANYLLYNVAVVEQGSASAFYTGTFPAQISPGVYSIVAKQQVAGTAAETDPTIAQGDIQWNGSVTMPLSDLATSGQLGSFMPLRVAYGNMIPNFPFKMVGSVDHVTPFTSGIISGQISRDGGAFGALQSGAFTEVGLGWYKLQALTSGDLAAKTIALVFTGVGVSGGNADQRDFGLLTQAPA